MGEFKEVLCGIGFVTSILLVILVILFVFQFIFKVAQLFKDIDHMQDDIDLLKSYKRDTTLDVWELSNRVKALSVSNVIHGKGKGGRSKG